ncbi:FAD-dependent monooxygenase [Actinoplanes sp. NPDC049596]|uniref:FAD-dependent monooxygenase n=1 Tax=unclassified Actinoplanes TaxID=2626549 RepID=UPI00342965BC
MTVSRIAIIGAGVGGLTAAVALRREGFDCEVYERQHALPDDGYGIQISPNAAALLDASVFASAARPAVREIRRWRDNSVLTRINLGRYGTPYYTMRRGALIGALARGSNVRFGHRVASLSSLSELEGEVVVGADGLNSVVRGVLADDPPRYSGYVAYRAVVPVPLDRVVVWLGPDRHCVAYPIDEAGHTNVVAVAPHVSVGLADGFEEWHPAVRRLIAEMGDVAPHALHDRAPLPAWHRGRVVLIGDAAHPMLPFAAQGAGQAIEDAVVLAECLRGPEAYARFEATRRPRVDRVFAMSRSGLDSYHLPDGDQQRHRDQAMARTSADAFDWLYGHRATAAAT